MPAREVPVVEPSSPGVQLSSCRPLLDKQQLMCWKACCIPNEPQVTLPCLQNEDENDASARNKPQLAKHNKHFSSHTAQQGCLDWHGKLTDNIHRHFGEPPPACNSMCDICTASVKRAALEDCTAAAQAMLAVLEAAFKAKKHATLVQLLDAWQKSKVCSSIRPGFVAYRLAPLCVSPQHVPSATLSILLLCLLCKAIACFCIAISRQLANVTTTQ